MEELADNVFLQRHPLNLMGCRMGRNVTIVRLSSGRLLIHSTAAFSEADKRDIEELGEPGWLVEATNFHDTCTLAGRQAFPEIPLLVPPGFSLTERASGQQILPESEAWENEVQVIPIEGMPKIREHVLFHHPSRTLIIADLFFNLPPSAGWWTHAFLRFASGLKSYPGMSRLFKFFIKDRESFVHSIRQIAALDFERIVVAHGEPITENARQVFHDTMAGSGFNLGIKSD